MGINDIRALVAHHHHATQAERRAMMALGIERLRDAVLLENVKPESLKSVFTNEQYRKPPPCIQRLMVAK